ncbi:hypothetical protein BsWGS_00497 [Bradybaena similaris]
MEFDPEEVTLSAMALMTPAQLQALEEKYVIRTIRCVPEKFIEMCHMHLAFLLDLSGDKLEVLLSDEDEHKKKKSGLASIGVTVFKKKEKPSAGFFGLPLTDAGVYLASTLINFLKLQENVCKEGIFRKPGNKCRMNALRELLISHGRHVSIDTTVYNAYDIAGVLKEFLRELPEPLLTERHMEAHRQVIDLGKHASTQEEISRYTQKKLSALQLLMLLLPSPVKKLTMQLLQLLSQIANCAETKMTPTTLGTIFAPIFFIDRSVEGTELCSQASHMAPAVCFMIENIDNLFNAPQELVVDLAHYWNAQASPNDENVPESGHNKHLTGRTVNTTVCYLDRELSRCDVASNTQTELANLLAHVQSLPDTPNNMKLKRQVMKTSSTPVSSTKKQGRSTSLSASIKKRLPSLGRSKNKNEEVLRASISSACNGETKPDQGRGVRSYNCTDKVAVVHCEGIYSRPLRKRLNFSRLHHSTEAPTMCELLESPVHHPEQRNHQRSRLRRRFQSTSENSDSSADFECSPPKQECKGLSPCDPVAFTGRDKNSCIKEFANKAQSCDRTHTSVVQKMLDHVRDSPAATQSRKCLSPKLTFHQLENEISYVPHVAAPKIKAPLTPRRDKIQVAKPKPIKEAWIPLTTRALVNNNSVETSI